MSQDSAEDRAIKRSANDVPTYSPKASAKALTDGALYNAVRSVVDDQVDGAWTHCKVIDYPSFNPAFTWYRVNYYYQNDEDPTTTVDSWVVTVDDVRKVYPDVDTVA